MLKKVLIAYIPAIILSVAGVAILDVGSSYRSQGIYAYQKLFTFKEATRREQLAFSLGVFSGQTLVLLFLMRKNKNDS